MKKGKRKYVEYNYEATYIEDIDHATDSKIERLLKQGKIKSVYKMCIRDRVREGVIADI